NPSTPATNAKAVVNGRDRARAGVLPGGDARVPAGHLAEPARADQLDGGGDRRDGDPRFLSGPRGHRPDEGRGKGPPMSGQDTAVTTPKHWFVVHTYSGFEEKVAQAIESRAKIFNLSEKIGRVLVPT